MTRRSLLASLAFRPTDIEREIFLRSPGKGTAVMALAFYRRRSGGEMISIEQRWSRSDTIDLSFYRRSRDFGKTWTPPEERKTGERRPEGMLRRHPRGGFVDPVTGRYIEIWIEGTLPSDDPLEGSRQWQIFYRVDEKPQVHQLIHRGDYNAEHPLPGVWRGKNSVMLGDQTCQPISLPDGTILLPVCISPLAPDGTLFNPLKGYTFHWAAAIRGRWKRSQLEWEMSPVITVDPELSTRGLDEPTLGLLSRNRVLMVLRGSNDRRPENPSYRWFTISNDGGRTWDPVKPWTYTKGENFFSPAACSQLVAHPNGKLYWLGNIRPDNPRGNRPRYPFVIGEVDRESGLLIRDSVRTVDDRQPGEDPILTLSNFYARLDRPTGGIALHMTRLFAKPDGWEGDAMLYRIPAV